MTREKDPRRMLIVLEAGPIRMDRLDREVKVHGRLCPLTPTEYELLETLLLGQGSVLPVDELMAKIWARTDVIENLRFYIHALRRKLGSAGEQVQLVRNEGYTIP
jgi:two-component system, OmpR family, alkaline phosphatase synthesis response regulator PhoP